MNRRVLLNCKVLQVYPQSVCYPACPQCYCKLYTDLQQTSFQCLKCRETYKKPQQRYRLRLSVCDDASTGEVTVFGSHLDAIIGSSATALHSYMTEGQQYGFPMDELLASALSQCLLAASFIFGFKLNTRKDLGTSPDLATLLRHAPVSSGTTLSSTQYSGPSLVAWQIFTPDGFPPKTTVSQHLRFLVKQHQNGASVSLNISEQNIIDALSNTSHSAGHKSFLNSLVELEDSRLDVSDFKLSQGRSHCGRSLALSCESTLNASDKSDTSANQTHKDTRLDNLDDGDPKRECVRTRLDMSQSELSLTHQMKYLEDFSESIEIQRQGSMDGSQPVLMEDISECNLPETEESTLDIPYVSIRRESKDTEQLSRCLHENTHHDFSDDSELENYQYSEIETKGECFLTRKSLHPINDLKRRITIEEELSQRRKIFPQDFLESDSESSQENSQKKHPEIPQSTRPIVNQGQFNSVEKNHQQCPKSRPKVNWAQLSQSARKTQTLRIISSEDLQRFKQDLDDSGKIDAADFDDTFDNTMSDSSFNEKVSRINQMVSRMAETFSHTFPEYHDCEKDRPDIVKRDNKDEQQINRKLDRTLDFDETVDDPAHNLKGYNAHQYKNHNVLNPKNHNGLIHKNPLPMPHHDETIDTARDTENQESETLAVSEEIDSDEDEEADTSEVILNLPNSADKYVLTSGEVDSTAKEGTSCDPENIDVGDDDNDEGEEDDGECGDEEEVEEEVEEDESVCLLANSEPPIPPVAENNHTNSEYDRSIQLPRGIEGAAEKTMSQDFMSTCPSLRASVTVGPEYAEGSEQNEWTEMPYSEGLEDVLHEMSEFSFILDQKKAQGLTKEGDQGCHKNMEEEIEKERGQRKERSLQVIEEEESEGDASAVVASFQSSESTEHETKSTHRSKTLVRSCQIETIQTKVQDIHDKPNQASSATVDSSNEKEDLKVSGSTFGSGQTTCLHITPPASGETVDRSGKELRESAKQKDGHLRSVSKQVAKVSPTEELGMILTPVTDFLDKPSGEDICKEDREGICEEDREEICKGYEERIHDEDREEVCREKEENDDEENETETCKGDDYKGANYNPSRTAGKSQDDSADVHQNVGTSKDAHELSAGDRHSLNEKSELSCVMNRPESVENSPYSSFNGSLDLFDGSADLFSGSEICETDEDMDEDLEGDGRYSDAVSSASKRSSMMRTSQNENQTKQLQRKSRNSEAKQKRTSEISKETRAADSPIPAKRRLKSVAFSSHLYTEKSIGAIDTQMAETPSPQVLITRRKSNLKSSSTPIDIAPKGRKTQSTDQENADLSLPYSEELFSPSPISGHSSNPDKYMNTPSRKSFGDVIPNSAGTPLFKRAILGAMTSNLASNCPSNLDRNTRLSESLFSSSSVENSPYENSRMDESHSRSVARSSQGSNFNHSGSLFASSSELFSDASCLSPTQPSDSELCKNLNYK